MTINSAARLCHRTTGPTRSWSTLQKWVIKPVPVISKCKSGYYLCVESASNQAFMHDENLILVHHLLEWCPYAGFVGHAGAGAVATGYWAELLENNIHNRESRVRLKSCRFGCKWTTDFFMRESAAITNKVPRIFDNFWFIAFNAFSIGSFFAQISIVYQNYEISRASPVFNLNETGFSPGNDVVGTKQHRMVTPEGQRWLFKGVVFIINIEFLYLLLCMRMESNTHQLLYLMVHGNLPLVTEFGHLHFPSW